jgi:hypothetical protein
MLIIRATVRGEKTVALCKGNLTVSPTQVSRASSLKKTALHQGRQVSGLIQISLYNYNLKKTNEKTIIFFSLTFTKLSSLTFFRAQTFKSSYRRHKCFDDIGCLCPIKKIWSTTTYCNYTFFLNIFLVL